MKKNWLAYHHKPGFQVPKDYFEELEDKVMHAVTKEQAMEVAYKGRPGFDVPEEYFANLDSRIMRKIEEQKEDDKVISIFRTPKYYYAAAVVAVFLGVFSTLLFNPSIPEYSIDGVELSALEEYIDKGYVDLNFNEISAFISEEGEYIENFNISGLNDEDVVDYLNEHVEDPNLLFD